MNIDFSNIDKNVRRYARAAQEHGYLDEPDHETMICACGYEGPPEAIIRYSEWDEADLSDSDTFICPGCGDA
ncbi:hypothetical protein [Natrinema gari]|uniref:Uncharacterized protein n=1 Tax=Natrinema gari JCM 14663 TaxID=1230459 RepID=L9ZG22_9EURY|nr:hypothetical protein [Natrinema gari]ELY85410.1 hypothetical protein C486_00025 [Natrinema gari JCM 14663]